MHESVATLGIDDVDVAATVASDSPVSLSPEEALRLRSFAFAHPSSHDLTSSFQAQD